MKKRILALLLSVLFILGTSSVTTAVEADSVTAVNGTVTIEATTTAEAGCPVLLFVLPTIIDEISGEDVTAARVAAVASKANLVELDVQYITAVFVDADGKINHTCQMSDDLATGLYSVVISYLGSEEGVYGIGTFDYVSKAHIEGLRDALNGSNPDTCGTIIGGDIVVDDDAMASLDILYKNSANTAYYEDEATDKTTFHQIYYQLKGDDDFTSSTVFTAFNETVAWTRLRTEADTLEVLKAYNGEGTEKYWNLPIGDDSDFAGLGDEQATILSAVKGGKYTDKATLEADFHDLVLIGMFRNLETREELASLIGETSPYAAEFAGVRDILSEADLDPFDLITVQTNILAGVGDCYTIEDVEALFSESLPAEEEEEEEEDNEYVGGVTSGKTPVVKFDSELHPTNPGYVSASFPFQDVAKDHWAKAYIQELYEKGAINGVSEDTFNASGNIYRQDFVKILVGALDMTVTDSESTFSDVPKDAYYTKFVMTACENGLVQGMGEGFGVGTNITRQDAAVILSRVLAKYGAEQSGEAADFADESMISDYAKEAVKTVRAAGIFGGDEHGNFNPKAHLSRAEACAILCRLAEML